METQIKKVKELLVWPMDGFLVLLL